MSPRPQDPTTLTSLLEILKWTQNYFECQQVSSTPRLDAEVLLADVLDCERVWLYANYDQPLQPEERRAYRAYVKRRVAGEPVAYIVGHKEFWSMKFKTDKRALIPRPETEQLVEKILERVDRDQVSSLVDVGTGAGPIALAVAAETDRTEIMATDKSKDALQLAAENARRFDVADRVDFYCGDLLAPIPRERLPVDCVASNPPYISEDEYESLPASIREYEPRSALLAGDEGLDLIRRLLDQALAALGDDGVLLCEIGWLQADAFRRLAEEAGFESIAVEKDLSGRDRVGVATP